MTATVGGVLSGVNPFHYNSGSPITLFTFQACVILILSNLIHSVMSKIRQPRVISEVLTGIILGPTALGQIPNYTATIFPTSSIPGLNLVANFGIILFMFFLGLEVDIHFIRQNIKTALSIGLATLVVPFGFGCLFALPLYNNYMGDTNVKFTVFMVFIAVSLSITAFPVLCRILAELRLVKERVGVIVLTSGTLNDVFGWILLALCIILSNSQSKPVNVVYILLCTLGWILFCTFPVRYFLKWVLVRSNELSRDKPSSLSTLLILVMMFLSAYFTDIIGVHPIFGAFIAGLIVPRDEGYVVKLAERMEDIPNLVMIPIYFTIAGLNVDLTLLNEGKDWGFAFASIGIAIATKVIAGCLTSKLNGLFWRESIAVGVLMSCKGIVEIVVLTTGLSAGIISNKVYAMFIFMALISTFVTTPLTIWLFPESYREEIRKGLENSEDLDSEAALIEKELNRLECFGELDHCRIRRATVVLNNLETLSSIMSLLNPIINGQYDINNDVKISTSDNSKSASTKTHITDDEALTICLRPSGSTTLEEKISLKTFYLKLLSDRTTDVLQNSTMDRGMPADSKYDNSLQIFEIFSDLMHVEYYNEVIFSAYREKAAIIKTIFDEPSDIIFFPLKGSTGDMPGNLTLPSIKPTDAIQQIFNQNEVSDGFFQSIVFKPSSSMAFLISNQSKKPTGGKSGKISFVLLLPGSTLSKSDYLALYLMFLVSHGVSKDSKKAVKLSIFVNSRNEEFELFYTQKFSGFNDTVEVFNVQVDDSIQKGVDGGIEPTSFIDQLFMRDTFEDKLKDIQGSTFIISDSRLSRDKAFSRDVSSLIATGYVKSFDVVICRHYLDDLI